MGLSDHAGPLQVFGGLSLGLLLFGFAFEGQSLLQLFGDVEGIKAPLCPDHRLEGKRMEMHTLTQDVGLMCEILISPNSALVLQSSSHRHTEPVKHSYQHIF